MRCCGPTSGLMPISSPRARTAPCASSGGRSSAGGRAYTRVFVIRGQTAVKTEVRVGIANFEYYEVEEGLIEGDEVIISAVKDYLHLDEVQIK